MVKLAGIFSRLSSIKVLVVGDFFLDSYTIGKARRISPEAPVPIVNVIREEHRPGGAGNVVLNLISLGAKVEALGRVGPDANGRLLKYALEAEGLSSEGLFTQTGYATPIKNRIIADNQQIVRIDCEEIVALPEQLEQEIIDALPQILEGVDIVAVSDYGKGFLSSTLLEAITIAVKERKIPIIVDPKGIDFKKYSGATIIKPNLGEAYAAANLPLSASLDQVAEKILSSINADMLMVTRSEAGISIFEASGLRHDFPVRIREVKDVTGAGDTVLAMLAYAMGNGLSIHDAAQLSNLAAGVAIERFGCARVSLADVARYLLDHDTSNKIFEDSHLFALQQAVHGHSVLLLDLTEQTELTPIMLKHLLALGNRQESELVVLISKSPSSGEFADVLRDLHAVDFIVIQAEGSRSDVTSLLKPQEIYQLEGENLQVLAKL